MTMRRIDLQPLEPFTSDFIDRTGAFNPGALEAATVIIEQVRQEGDGALRALTEKFDGVAIENFRVPPEAIDAAMAEVDPDTLEALRHAAAQIRDRGGHEADNDQRDREGQELAENSREGRKDTANLNGNQVVIADTDGSEDGREDDRSDHPHEDSGFTQERAHVFHLEIRDDGSLIACPNFTHS